MLAEDKKRLTRLLTIAFPMIISSASETVMLFADRWFLSQVSKVHLAAAMSGGLTSFVLSSLFGGLVGYVNAIVAQYYGANNKHECARAENQAIYLSLLLYPILLLFIPVSPHFFRLMGHSPEQVRIESAYINILLSGTVFFILRNALTGFFAGIGKTRIVMVANIAGMVINIPLNYMLIFGNFGFPEMGIQGAAIGTICGSFTTFFILFIRYFFYIQKKEFFHKNNWKFSKEHIVKLLRFGSPAGLELFMNVFAFDLFVLTLHSYGADVAAAVTITFNWDLVAFIPMLGMGIATTALVGQHIGAQDVHEAEKSAYLALKVSYLYSCTMVLVFLIGAPWLVSLFSSGFKNNLQVNTLAVILLRMAAIYTLADTTQLIFSGALRGAGDTKWVMRASVILHWTMTIVTVLLIRLFKPDPILIWGIFVLFVLVLSGTMYLRFRSHAWKKISLIHTNTSANSN